MVVLREEIPVRWHEQAEMLGNRLKKRRQTALRWATREETDCFRIYDRDIPELPFAIDLYADHLHAAVYARTEPLEPDWVHHVILEAAARLAIAPEQVAIKQRERMKGTRQYERRGQHAARVRVHEQGHRFWVNLTDYLDTGLFLDHRRTRRRIQQEACGKRFLNLFAYTGSFGVYAAAGGATRVVQVDLSRTYLDWAKENLVENGADLARCVFVQEDTWSYLAEAKQAGAQFDLVMLDPPTFSNSKRMAQSFDVKRDHLRLLQATIAVLAPGGVLYFSTNAHHFQLDAEALIAAVDVEVSDVTEETRAPDFQGRHSHRAFRIARPAG